MTLEDLANKVIEAADAAGMPFMVVGAIAAGVYGVPRSTRDVDFLVAFKMGEGVDALIGRLSPWVEFDPQVVFDTLTWGRRQVGKSRTSPPFKVELFELFDDPFVQEEFGRRRKVFVPLLKGSTWLPTAEDVVVQKLRWGRNKDLDDVSDVLAVQGLEKLDMNYVREWCARHGTTARLQGILDSLPPL